MLILLISCTRPPSGIDITWFGVTTALIESSKSTILIDPYFSRPPFDTDNPTQKGHALYASIMEAAQIEQLDAILVSHGHFDHVIDVGIALLYSDTQVYGSQTTCFIAQAHGIPADRCTVVTSLESFAIHEFNITPIRTPHWWSDAPPGLGGSFAEYTEIPSLEGALLSPNGGMLSYLIETSGTSIFVQPSMDAIDSDDGSGEDFVRNFKTLFSDRPPVDVWMMCGDCLDQQEEVEGYVEYLKPKNSLFMHWDAANPITENHGLDESLPSSFSPPPSYTNALSESTLWIPTQHFQAYTYVSGNLKEENSPLQAYFFPE